MFRYLALGWMLCWMFVFFFTLTGNPYFLSPHSALLGYGCFVLTPLILGFWAGEEWAKK